MTWLTTPIVRPNAGDIVFQDFLPRSDGSVVVATSQTRHFVTGLFSVQPGGTSVSVRILNADDTFTSTVNTLGGDVPASHKAAGARFVAARDVPAPSESFVVTWTDQDFSDDDVYAMQFTGAGRATGAAVRLHGETGGKQRFPDIAQLSDGRYIATWSSDDVENFQDLPGSEVFGRFFSRSLTPLAPEFLVNRTTTNALFFTDVAPLAGGGFVVAWAEAATTIAAPATIRAQIYDASGDRVGRPLTLFSNASTTPFFELKALPTFSGLAGGGFELLVTQGDRIESVRFSGTGARIGADSEPRPDPLLAVFPDGRKAQVRSDESAIRVQVLDADGAASGAPIVFPLSDFSLDDLNIPANVTPLQGPRVARAVAAADGRVVLFVQGPFVPGDVDRAPVSALFQVTVDTTVYRGTDLTESAQGGGFADALSGAGGNDALRGLGNDDTLEGGAGADLLDGGEGEDTASYASSPRAVSVALDGAARGGDAAGDVLRSIENLTGSAFDDLLTGDAQANILRGGEGDDGLRGLDGDDRLDGEGGDNRLEGGDGNDVYRSFSGDDAIRDTGGAADQLRVPSLADIVSSRRGGDELLLKLSGPTGSRQITVLDHFTTEGRVEAVADGTRRVVLAAGPIGGPASGLIAGTSEADTLDGEGGDDLLFGEGGDDVLIGGEGDDRLEGGSGRDRLDGGDGLDLLSYLGSPAGVRVSLALGRALGGDALGDQFTKVENIAGSPWDDVLSGSREANRLEGGSGSDILAGGAGDDILDGGSGDDLLIGGFGTDTVVFTGARADYQVTPRASGGLTIRDLRARTPDGVDTAFRVERFQFSDGVLGAFEAVGGLIQALPEFTLGVSPFAEADAIAWSFVLDDAELFRILTRLRATPDEVPLLL